MSTFVNVPVGPTFGKRCAQPTATAMTATAATSPPGRLRTTARTTSPAASATRDERENVHRSPAAETTESAITDERRRNVKRRATTNRYPLASGLRNVET